MRDRVPAVLWSRKIIFINFSKEPVSFDEFIEPNKPYIELHGLKDAKIAYRKIYPTHGNWKLTLDNFHECYHCQPSHPEYCSVHDPEYILAYGGGSGTGPHSEKFSRRLVEWNEKTKKKQIPNYNFWFFFKINK